MVKNNPIKVIKIPLDPREKRNKNVQAFPRMPQLYLELLENKQKIKQNLVNTDYVPTGSPVANTTESYQPSLVQKMNSIVPSSPSAFSNGSSDHSRNLSDASDFSDSEAEDEGSVDVSDDAASDISHESNEDKLSRRLKDLLDDDSHREPTRPREHFKDSKDAPPTLSELENRGTVVRERHLPEIGRGMGDEEEEDLKREMLFKFDILRKSYGAQNSNIPEFTIHSDYRTMERSYEETMRKLSIDSTVDNYKTYLIGGFMLVEFVLGKFLKFDMEGFTQQQIVNMSSYERLLIELGEKSYAPEGSNWPVEIRLVFLIIINAAFFVVSKILMKNTGTNILNMINSMNVNSNNNSQQIPKAKRKMKGPDLNFDDLSDLSDEE